MVVVITGADGFIGRNLGQHLAERKNVKIHRFSREQEPQDLPALLDGADLVFHLAGINRPRDAAEFDLGNTGLTEMLCRVLVEQSLRTGRRMPFVVFASSTQADNDNQYGRTKLAAEQALLAARDTDGLAVRIFRLPNVFGKWAKPNYNSVVATFCHNVARDLPIQVHDPKVKLTLVYIDDVVDAFMTMVNGDLGMETFCTITPKYDTTVGDLAVLIEEFHNSRKTLVTERVGSGFVRALYATYVSYLPTDRFAYEIPVYSDARGVFVEMLKTRDSGQCSLLTIRPGVTRGGHYHHSKSEKFLVVKGKARFRFRHILSKETHELLTSGERPTIVETVPGWTHDITNVTEEELIVMLWANEIFDRNRPDTFACPI